MFGKRALSENQINFQAYETHISGLKYGSSLDGKGKNENFGQNRESSADFKRKHIRSVKSLENTDRNREQFFIIGVVINSVGMACTGSLTVWFGELNDDDDLVFFYSLSSASPISFGLYLID